MTNINFTKTEQARLNELAGEALFKGTKFKGNLGTEQSIHDLIHNCTIGGLDSILVVLNKQVEGIRQKSRWTMTDYQKQKASNLEKAAELVDLLIGYKYWQEQLADTRTKLSAAKATIAKLEEDKKTPEDRLKEAQELAALLEKQLEAV